MALDSFFQVDYAVFNSSRYVMPSLVCPVSDEPRSDPCVDSSADTTTPPFPRVDPLQRARLPTPARVRCRHHSRRPPRSEVSVEQRARGPRQSLFARVANSLGVPDLIPRPLLSSLASVLSSVGPIVASVISVVVALVAVSLIVFLLMRRRRRAQEAAKADAMDTRSIDGDDSAYAVAKDEGTTPGSDVAPAMPVLTPFLYPHNAPPRALSIRELPPLNVVVDRSPITSAVTSPADAEGSPATSSSEHLQPANPAFASGTRRSKTGKIAVSAPSLSVAEERRLRVYGRESDAGPIGRPQVDEEEGETMLPPDYHQVSIHRGRRIPLRLSVADYACLGALARAGDTAIRRRSPVVDATSAKSS